MPDNDDLLTLEYVELDLALLWEDNHKLHNLPSLIASFERHGFKDPPKFEPSLNEGRGGIVEGNGRMEALSQMRRDKIPAPRGVQVIDGKWLVPVLFGVDAASQAAAEAYGIDHNNLTLAGGLDNPHSRAMLWDDDFNDQLQRLIEQEEVPVSVDPDDLGLGFDDDLPLTDLDALESEYGEPGERDFWPFIRVQVSPETMELWESLLVQTGMEDDAGAVALILGAVDATAFSSIVS